MNNDEIKNIDCIDYYSCIGEYITEFKNTLQKMFFNLSIAYPLGDIKEICSSEGYIPKEGLTPELLILYFDCLSQRILKSIEESQELLVSITDVRDRFSEHINIRERILHSTRISDPELESEKKMVDPTSGIRSTGEDRELSVDDKMNRIKAQIIELRTLSKDFKSVMDALFVSHHESIFLKK